MEKDSYAGDFHAVGSTVSYETKKCARMFYLGAHAISSFIKASTATSGFRFLLVRMPN